MKIFAIGTCRTHEALWGADPFIKRERMYNTVVCHYCNEIIQMIKFLKSKVRIAPSDCNSVFTDSRSAILFKKRIENKFDCADHFIIEISSVKNLRRNGVYHNINRVPKSRIDRYEMILDTEQDIVDRIKEIDSLLNHRKTLYVSHINVKVPGKGYIEQRQLLQTAVKRGAEEVNQEFFDISSCIKRLGYEKSFSKKGDKMDVNHISPEAVKAVRNHLKQFLGI